ncbi:uncharacterized protein [Solanum tuberosum]|uniref:uncharacterized protein n=1 Tax=Solanum tuberosum TaxID=4113 RepID=UPI00073A51F6|nr:PREDICTED: uncharacterized protein LOC107062559 [Solanum tuberosum]
MNSDALKYDNFIQVLLDELKDWEREFESGKQRKYNNNMCWLYFLKGFKILESTTRQLSLEFQWMKGKKAKEQREATKELEHNIHMVKAPSVLDKEPSLMLPTKVKVSQKKYSEENLMEE